MGTRGRASASGEGPAESARVQGGAAKVEAEAKAGGGGAECEGARVRGGRARVCNPIRRRGCPAILCTCRAGATIRVEVTLCYGVEVTFIWETMAKVEASMWARERKPSRFMMR